MLAKEKKVRNTESRSEPVIIEVTVVIFKKTVIEFFCVKEIKRFSSFKSVDLINLSLNHAYFIDINMSLISIFII